MSFRELPKLDPVIKERFKNAVFNCHGRVWGKLSEEIDKAFLFYLEKGPLQYYDKENPEFESNAKILDEISSADVDKRNMSIDEFFKIFDNEHIYVYDKIEADYFKGIVFKITEHESDPNWRHWSKIVRESGRLKWLRGTKFYQVNRYKFKYIDADLKVSYDTDIKQRQLESYSIQEDHATRIYKKLTPGKVTNLKEVCKLGRIPEKEAKKAIKKLESEYKFQFVGYGKWKVLDPAAAKDLKENSLFRAGE